MNVIEIIAKKRDGLVLSWEELYFIVQEFTRGTVPDYQMSAFLMAIYVKGMVKSEVLNLTQAMVSSGDTLDLSSVPGLTVDKHSTGGVGDKTTLVLAPLVASAGIPVAKLSGRALGHTGGTLDKLESIPGLRVDLSAEELVQQVKKIGIAIASQSKNLVPADKKIYSLRNVTATISSLPLIASSVMSKKLAAGAGAIILDVKAGKGAFIHTLEEAKDLANLMIAIGKSANRKMCAVISKMDEPLGYAIGNSIEVKEAIDTLHDNGPQDLTELCLVLGAQMLLLTGKVKTSEDGKRILTKQLKEGRAWKTFLELVRAQGGTIDMLLAPNSFPQTELKDQLVSHKSGFVHTVDALLVGEASLVLGAGRLERDEEINHAVGIRLNKKVGDKVGLGENLAIVYSNKQAKLGKAKKILAQAFQVYKEKPVKSPLIYQILK